MHFLRLASILIAAAAAVSVVQAQSDLDAFMQQVLARRDDNWRKQQQYVLDEREAFEVRGPGQALMWGERREYTWYIRDGFFVRSPVKANGVTIADADRRKYEADFLKRAQERDQRAKERQADPSALPEVAALDAPRDLDGLIRQTEQPGFISSAYFLRFKFDAGRYALVGRERLENRDVLRIEYYPRNLFSGDAERERERQRQRERRREMTAAQQAEAEQLRQLMNRTSRVTLWIDPASHQILKYTFDDLGWDFLPGAWLLRVNDVTASMTVSEVFPDVWLPRGIDMRVGMAFAAGPLDLTYRVDYVDYRKADVEATFSVPGAR